MVHCRVTKKRCAKVLPKEALRKPIAQRFFAVKGIFLRNYGDKKSVAQDSA